MLNFDHRGEHWGLHARRHAWMCCMHLLLLLLSYAPFYLSLSSFSTHCCLLPVQQAGLLCCMMRSHLLSPFQNVLKPEHRTSIHGKLAPATASSTCPPVSVDQHFPRQLEQRERERPVGQVQISYSLAKVYDKASFFFPERWKRPPNKTRLRFVLVRKAGTYFCIESLNLRTAIPAHEQHRYSKQWKEDEKHPRRQKDRGTGNLS